MSKRPTLWMLIGVPCSGKSTWIDQGNFEQGRGRDTTILSTDYFIELVAKSRNKTYGEVFKETIKDADAKMYRDLQYALDKDHNIIWDQTNISRGMRMKKLKRIPDHYEKIAVVFSTPDPEELKRRLDSRPGKTIPDHVLKSMIENFEYPSKNEGFDYILTRYEDHVYV